MYQFLDTDPYRYFNLINLQLRMVLEQKSVYFRDGVTPGPDWIESFVKRHKGDLRIRVAFP